MAVVLAFRVGVMLAPLVLRTWAHLQGPELARWNDDFNRLKDRFYDPEEDDATLSADYSAISASNVTVATYATPFELRKMVVLFTQLDGASLADDQRACSFHLLKLAGGTPQSDWVQADFDAAVNAVDAFWNAIKVYYPVESALDRIKFYKAGPAISPPQPPVYEVDRNLAGGVSNQGMPPQVAITVTEMAGTKPHWGRFYLPAIGSQSCNQYGRLVGTRQTVIADAADVMYTAFKTANIPAVVYRRHLDEREKKNGTTLPERPASAWTVDTIQVDDVFDVIRSRRWKYPALCVQRGI